MTTTTTKPTPTEEQRRETRETWTNPEIVGQDIGGACRAVGSLCDDLDAAIARAEKAQDWLRRIQPLVDAAADGMKKVAATDAWAEMEKARANLATVQREHDALTKSTEAARAAIAKALGLTEWRALADLAADVTDLGDALASARAEAERHEKAGRAFALSHAAAVDERDQARAEVARLTAERDTLRTIERTSGAIIAWCEGRSPWLGNSNVETAIRATVDGAKAALAASRAEVEALREALREALAEWRSVNMGYGAFPGGDPRLFSPDPECSTEAEREAHRIACEAYAGDPLAAAHQWVRMPEGHVVHLDRAMFGLGAYRFDDPAWASALSTQGELPLSSTPAPASAEPATPFTDEGSNGFVERAGKGSAKPATPTTSPDCPRESPLCITKGFHAADECDVATPTTEGGAK